MLNLGLIIKNYTPTPACRNLVERLFWSTPILYWPFIFTHWKMDTTSQGCRFHWLYLHGHSDFSLFIPLLGLSFSTGSLGTILSNRQEVLKKNGLEVVIPLRWVAYDVPKCLLAGVWALQVTTLSLTSLQILLGFKKGKGVGILPLGRILIKDKHIPRCPEIEVTWMLSDFLASKINLFHVSPKKINTFYLLQYQE